MRTVLRTSTGEVGVVVLALPSATDWPRSFHLTAVQEDLAVGPTQAELA